jgi:metal-responsive CopG/Arc/MetJ family transcriptional regulator
MAPKKQDKDMAIRSVYMEKDLWDDIDNLCGDGKKFKNRNKAMEQAVKEFLEKRKCDAIQTL